MSGEFGSYIPGYMGFQILTAAADCRGGNYTMTKLFGALLEAITEMAYQVALAEAGDDSEQGCMNIWMQDRVEIVRAVQAIDAYIDPYQTKGSLAIAAKDLDDTSRIRVYDCGGGRIIIEAPLRSKTACSHGDVIDPTA